MKRIDADTLAVSGKKFKVRDLMLVDNDIDVYDNVCESLAIAFCNPFDDEEVHDWDEYLTERGMKQFADVLDYPTEIIFGNAIVCVDDSDDKVWKTRLKRAKRFFESAAGYCSCEDYNKWFRM